MKQSIEGSVRLPLTKSMASPPLHPSEKSPPSNLRRPNLQFTRKRSVPTSRSFVIGSARQSIACWRPSTPATTHWRKTFAFAWTSYMASLSIYDHIRRGSVSEAFWPPAEVHSLMSKEVFFLERWFVRRKYGLRQHRSVRLGILGRSGR